MLGAVWSRAGLEGRIMKQLNDNIGSHSDETNGPASAPVAAATAKPAEQSGGAFSPTSDTPPASAAGPAAAGASLPPGGGISRAGNPGPDAAPGRTSTPAPKHLTKPADPVPDLSLADDGAPTSASRPSGSPAGERDTATAAKAAPSAPPASSGDPGADAATPAPEMPDVDLKDPALYLNRELTWLEFNRRVLNEAEDERTPLLERVKFLAIVSANLDEFFMKRIGGLKQQVGAGVVELTVDGRTPQQQIDESHLIVEEIEGRKERLLPQVLNALAEHEIEVLSYEDLEQDERDDLRKYYIENIIPLVTPQAIDPAHPFPFISNLSLNLLVTLRSDEGQSSCARVKVPVGAGIPRFLRVGDGYRFVPLEQVMSGNLDLLFPRMDVEACELFYVTRNANLARESEIADDLLAMIESEVRERRFASIVRVKIAQGMDSHRRGWLAAELGLDPGMDVFESHHMLAMRHLFEIASLDVSALRDPPHYPLDHARLADASNIFYAIRDAGSILLQHPYESFTKSVERFVAEASTDPKVRAIKMTLYRTSGETKILDHLIDAASNGKQVAVVVELKARFDEAANIRWASRLEEAGIHVTYGVMGLKTHCKVILVVRQDFSGLRLYAHVGTGNYHAGTARLYGDLGLMTCDEEIGRDLVELFNYLTTGYTPKRLYRKILPAPKQLKRALLRKIKREIELQSKEDPGHIQFKANALEDADVVEALYEASRAGVRIDLIVRDTCRLRPGIPGISDNVNVVSIVGRFLEHCRIYYFHNGGDEEYYIGSADAMKRNLEQRVEALVPVEDPALRQELREMIDLQLADNRNGWDMQSDGSYVQRRSDDPEETGSQQKLISHAEERARVAQRLKRRKPQTIVRRTGPGRPAAN
jgi:polyphosphate kinase